jgi:predicted ATPase with chaperone activity
MNYERPNTVAGLVEKHKELCDLRQPLEAGETVIARAQHRISYPSRIQLVESL